MPYLQCKWPALSRKMRWAGRMPILERKTTMKRTILLVLLVGAPLLPAQTGDKNSRIGPDPQVWDAVVGKAIQYARSAQEANGGWSTAKSPGVTGVLLTGLLRSGKVTSKDPIAERALKYIENLA